MSGIGLMGFIPGVLIMAGSAVYGIGKVAALILIIMCCLKYLKEK